MEILDRWCVWRRDLGNAIDSSPDQLLSQADQALYLAKNNGRNQFLIYSESVLPTNPKYTQNRKRTIA